MSPLSARSDCTDSDIRIKQTRCQASPPVSFSSSGCTYSSGFVVWIPPHSLSLSFLAPVKNEVAQPLRSAGTEVDILLGSFVSLDIPHAAINTKGILFDSRQSVSAGGASLGLKGAGFALDFSRWGASGKDYSAGWWSGPTRSLGEATLARYCLWHVVQAALSGCATARKALVSLAPAAL
jgi:hypothetical protein